MKKVLFAVLVLAALALAACGGGSNAVATLAPVPAEYAGKAIYVSVPLKTGRIMAKDENVCLHCGLCAERCPTGAWDM